MKKELDRTRNFKFYIQEATHTMETVASELNITVGTLKAKILQNRPFKESEIKTLLNLLGVKFEQLFKY